MDAGYVQFYEVHYTRLTIENEFEVEGEVTSKVEVQIYSHGWRYL